MKKRLTQVFGAIALLIVVGLTIDSLRVEAKERRVFHAISQCGGQCGSIPAWPLGTE